ncbi:MAG: hypothetical protein U5L96_17105 [Owenweeksia sp.]|nr:hypothetical protein [Owenweeksia sp.]
MADSTGEITFPYFFGQAAVQAKLQQQLIQQLEKDLRMTIASQNAEGLFKEVVNQLRHCQETGQLAQALYRADLAEDSLPDTAHEDDYFQLLSLLFIKREAQKVFFRWQFHRENT